MHASGGDLDWIGSYAMQGALNPEIDEADLVGAKVNPDDRDWNIMARCPQLLHVGEIWRGVSTASRAAETASQGEYDIVPAAGTPGINSNHDFVVARWELWR